MRVGGYLRGFHALIADNQMPKPTVKRAAKPADITETALRQLARNGVPLALRAHQEDDFYYLEVEVSGTTMRLLNSRGEFRTFSSLDTVANLVASLGVEEFKTTVAVTPRGR